MGTKKDSKESEEHIWAMAGDQPIFDMGIQNLGLWTRWVGQRSKEGPSNMAIGLNEIKKARTFFLQISNQGQGRGATDGRGT